MKLQPVCDFFNYSNNPWHPVASDRYGEWIPPGLVYNSCILHVLCSQTSKIERPAEIKMYTCLSVLGGSMDVMMYAGDAWKAWVDYPWKDGNMVEIARLHVTDTSGGVVSRRATATKEQTDAFMDMAGKTGELRIGVACKSTDGGKMVWHSASMLTSYD